MTAKIAELQSSIVTDLPTAHDLLEFKPYRDTLVDIISQGNTPLTIGIFGSWGSGKTSLLKMLEAELAKGASPKARLVWFNAWLYSQETALWRAFLSRILEALRPEKNENDVPADEKTKVLLKTLDDLQSSLYRTVEREQNAGIEIDWTKMVKGSTKSAIKLGLSYLPGGDIVKQLTSFGSDKEGSLNELLDAFYRDRTKLRIEQVQFPEQFRKSFAELVEKHIVKNGERFIVFVDDLDRCLPEKAIEVLEAIKLFLDVSGCVFVLAVDKKIIVEGIRVRYRDFALNNGKDQPMPINGEDFLEKIIQVPFNLPPVRTEDMAEYIRGQQITELDEESIKLFSLGVETNPRKIKRILNVFWMHSRLAQHRKNLKDIIQPLRLAKVVIIQEVYPDLYKDWVEAPLLLRDLEAHFVRADAMRRMGYPEDGLPREGDSAALEAARGDKDEAAGQRPAGLVEKWADRKTLRKTLLFKPGNDGGFKDLSQEELETYIYLTRTSAVTLPVEEADMDGNVWDSLVSGDKTRVESVVGGLKEKERPAYRKRLLPAILSKTEPTKHRVAAGLALGFLGDPRFQKDLFFLPDDPMLGFVEIPAGEFLMGSQKDNSQASDYEKPQHSLELPRYFMARYPVTVAQFKAFVAASAYEPADKDCMMGVANHPVVNVTWHEALAYCKWLTKVLREQNDTPELIKNLLRQGENGGPVWRFALPSEAEWEKAAKGKKGLEYPWGYEADTNLANYVETGIDATSTVGCFPGGASPYGCLDMAGNVWEWCLTKWLDNYKEYMDKVDNRVDGSKDTRVLRGGSFIHDARGVRCAARSRGRPDGRLWNLGFRVVFSPEK